MKLLRIGLVVAVMMAFAGHAMAADAPKLDADKRAQGMKEAPAIVQGADLDCAIDDAYFVGNGTNKVDGKDVTSKIYEVSCKQGIGYFLAVAPGAKAQAFDCLALKTLSDAHVASGGKPSQLCILPGNADPAAGLTPIMAKAGAPCTVSAGKYLGGSTADKFSLYEARCSDGRGYLLLSPQAGSSKTLSAVGCAEASLFATKCALTTDAEVTQQILAMAKSSNPPACQANAARWVLATVDGFHYYEVGCADGKSGYMFKADSAGAVKQVITCAEADPIGGGCTLTNVDLAKTQEAGLYTQQAKQIGYPCTVAKYETLGPETAATHREVVEMACAEHAGSVWALLPTGSGGDPLVVNCLRAQGIGLPKCKLTQPSATFADLGAQIKSKGKTCAVTNARYMDGVHSQQGSDFIEVACDGGPGMVIAYAPTKIEAVLDVFSCKETAGTTRACTLTK